MENSRKKRILVLLIVICLLLGIVGYYFYKHHGTTVYTNDAQIMGFETNISADIGPYRLEELLFDEGDMVKKGTLLARIDRSLIIPEYEKSKATILQQKAEIVFREASRLKIMDDYERAARGFQDKIISAQDLDHALRDLEMADASLELAKAQLAVANNNFNYLETKLAHTELRAPMNGQITKRWQWKGNVISRGQAVFSLYDLENIWVLANLQETDVAGVRLGDSVAISVDAYPHHTFEGKIFAIQGSAASQFSLIPPDNATGNYTKIEQRIPIKISIEKKEGEEFYLFPGMSAEVNIRVR